MPKLDKSTLALTFKFDCDRFLRLRLASDHERAILGIEPDEHRRPGINLIRAAGRQWETDRYLDLIEAVTQTKAGAIAFKQSAVLHELSDRHLFEPVDDLFRLLAQPVPPTAILEGEFLIPSNITPSLQHAVDTYGLQPVRARPDILWIRPARTGAPLLGPTDASPEYEIHIVDIKMAAEPSLRHFTEVTFYALALAAALAQTNLAKRYAVSAEGLIWPGSHDANEFRVRWRAAQARGNADPVTDALLQTLRPVPYEVYQVHVRQFLDDRLLRVLGQAPLDAAWHVAPKCQLCDYLAFCEPMAQAQDHLSRIAWLTQGQAELLRSRNITTTAALATAIAQDTPAWQAAAAASHQLRADAPVLFARAQALQQKQPVLVADRKTALMPAWSDMNIFLTVHFDPGSGITFALGASSVYWPPGRSAGDPPVTDEGVFIVDRAESLNPDTERARLLEFARLVTSWMVAVHEANTTQPPPSKPRTAHIFFWSTLEVTQLRRMFERHMTHPDVVELIELLVRLFPPDSVLPDPELFKSQPGTVVKDVFRHLVGLPLPHDYTLLDAANVFYPDTKSDGSQFAFRVPFGFATPMSDQIPFERAYELWQDRIFLRKYDPRYPNNPQRWAPYTRDALYEGIKSAVRTRLRALQHLVQALRREHGDRLVLRKAGFSAAAPVRAQVPEPARQLIAFEKLNAICAEVENRQARALPVAEREARFAAIRGLHPAEGAVYELYLTDLRTTDPRNGHQELWAFTFAPTSRDARIKEGDFPLVLSNEDSLWELDVNWPNLLDLSFTEAFALLGTHGLTERWMVNIRLSKLLQIGLIRLEPTQNPPFLVLAPAQADLFQFAQAVGFLDLQQPLVLDTLFEDFASKRVDKVLRTIGRAPTAGRRSGGAR